MSDVLHTLLCIAMLAGGTMRAYFELRYRTFSSLTPRMLWKAPAATSATKDAQAEATVWESRSSRLFIYGAGMVTSLLTAVYFNLDLLVRRLDPVLPMLPRLELLVDSLTPSLNDSQLRHTWSPATHHASTLSFAARGVGVGMVALGWLLVWWTHVAMRRNWMPIIAISSKQKVITTGPFQYVRHPMYLGILLLAIGMILSTLRPDGGVRIPLSLCWAVFAASVIRRIPAEEAVLVRELEGYAEYCKRCPYQLIPGV